MSDQVANAVGLAEKIVEDILKDPAKADEHKALLAATFQEIHEFSSATGTKEEKVKSLLTSKTFWGVVIGLAGQFGPKLGLHLPFGTADQTEVISQLVTICGAAFTLYGRVTATSKVTLTGK